MRATQFDSLLTNAERHLLHPPEAAGALGSVVVVAPHPDDESLGCGGLLALLAGNGNSPHVLVVTDGARSHPGSLTHPPALLSAIREQETKNALNALGIPKSDVEFMRFPDCGLPPDQTPHFDAAASVVRNRLASWAPDTLLIPWRRDPHCDHEATWRLMRKAVIGLRTKPRILEYPIWAWTRPDTEVAPTVEEGSAWRLDISPVLALKRNAVAQHRSQLGALIHDDPDGFVLQPEMLAHFFRPWELFLEPSDV
jgi:LmbE family N-acetylglucosaminyl deacetylase